MGFGGAMFAVAGAQAVSQIAQGYAGNSEAKANASMVEDTGRYNASVLQGKASLIDIQSSIEQGQYTRLKGQYLSKSTASIAKQGITPEGSAMAVMLDAQTQINIDQSIAKFNSDTSKNYTIAEANDAIRTSKLQADSLRRQGSASVRSGYAGAFSSMLQGGSNYLMYKLPKSTTFDYSTTTPSNTAPYTRPNMRLF